MVEAKPVRKGEITPELTERGSWLWFLGKRKGEATGRAASVRGEVITPRLVGRGDPEAETVRTRRVTPELTDQINWEGFMAVITRWSELCVVGQKTR